MECLNNLQVAVILQQLEENKIDDTLQTDLLDHICCDIENKMSQGVGFEDALVTTFKTFNMLYIYQLNVATQFLTNNNNMKTKTIVLGLAGLAISLGGYVGKKMSIMGSNELLVAGAAVIIFGFLLTATLNINKNLQIDSIKTINWLGFIGLSCITLGATLIILKYFMVAMILLVAGIVASSLYFAMMGGKIKTLVS